MAGDNRSRRAQLAAETLAILKAGAYVAPSGDVVDIRADLERCVATTVSYPIESQMATLEALDALVRARVYFLENPAFHDEREELLGRASIEVRNETTLEGLARIAADGGSGIAVLNFASARNPGGGFLGGSQAQEESLVRSSGLYASLLAVPEFYERHRELQSCIYSDAMIVSPDCPVFRDDAGRLRELPLFATFITSAAPNAGAIRANEPEVAGTIPAVLLQRARFALQLAGTHGCRNLVLGAWGCGVFRNDPVEVARAFATLLIDELWLTEFDRIVFSVLDTSKAGETFRAFEASLSRQP